LNPELPSKLPEIIGKALEKDRNLRYQHAGDILTDLKRLKRDTEPRRPAAGAFGSEKVPSPVIRPRPILHSPAAAIGVLLLLLGGLLMYRWSTWLDGRSGTTHLHPSSKSGALPLIFKLISTRRSKLPAGPTGKHLQ